QTCALPIFGSGWPGDPASCRALRSTDFQGVARFGCTTGLDGRQTVLPTGPFRQAHPVTQVLFPLAALSCAARRAIQQAYLPIPPLRAIRYLQRNSVPPSGVSGAL